VSPRGRAAAELLAVAALAAVAAAPASASRGCPGSALHRQAAPRDIAHPPKRAVLACVGTRPITGAQFAHWFAIEHRRFETFGRHSLTGLTLATLVAFAAVEGEAREHHIVVTARDVRRSFRHRLRTRFREPGSFRRFLKFDGESRADYLAEIRRDLLVAAIRRRESRAELARYNAKWQARTTCARAVADGNVCGLIAPFAAGPPAVGVPFGPDAIAIDPASDTLYVTTSSSLVLIDGRTCNAATTAGCAQLHTIRFGDTDLRGLAFDPSTATLYLANADGSVVVFDARACNATVARCQAAARIQVARQLTPDQLLLDPATHTLYVVGDDGSGTISVIDAAHCNALNRSGCGKAPVRLRTADDSTQAIAVNPATGTLYVANDDSDSVSLVDTRTCSALDASRCGAAAPAFKLPGIANPIALAVDPSTNALYVSAGTDELFALDGATCGATVLSGCAHPRTVKLRETGRAIAIDAPTHTAYLTGHFLGGVSLLDTATCNATVATGCAPTQPAAHAGREPNAIAIDERTRTVYVANGEERSISLLRADSCNATTTTGC
jgi:DNA-binding beta-propeller fold protein YncE